MLSFSFYLKYILIICCFFPVQHASLFIQYVYSFFTTLSFVSAYVSFVRSYASYPKNLREMFNFKRLHLGHYAKSMGLRETPGALGASAAFKAKREIKEKKERKEKKM